jgi:hypothetical protein
MSCTDTESGEVFHTPIYYREFIIENTPTVLNTPYITRKAEFPYESGFLGKNDNIKLYNVQQYENFVLQYAAYYNGKNSCDVEALIQYGTEEPTVVVAENLPLVLDGFSEIQDQIFPLNNSGNVTIILRAVYGDEYYEVKAESDVKPSDMVITTPSDNVVLDLNAFGQRTENVWEYTYLDAYGQEQKITTEFSQNRYVVISTRDVSNNVVPPYDATEENTLDVTEIPPTENEDYKYLRLEGEYYIWEREFDWSNTSGWSDNKLKLANGNAITINYQPFSNDKLLTIKEQGMTLDGARKRLRQNRDSIKREAEIVERLQKVRNMLAALREEMGDEVEVIDIEEDVEEPTVEPKATAAPKAEAPKEELADFKMEMPSTKPAPEEPKKPTREKKVGTLIGGDLFSPEDIRLVVAKENSKKNSKEAKKLAVEQTLF